MLAAFKDGLSVYIGNAAVIAAINTPAVKESVTWIGNVMLIAGALIFTYYKIQKMREEAELARLLRLEKQREISRKKS